MSSLPEFAEYLEKYTLDQLQIKFEILVPSSNPWMSSSLQMIFTSNAYVTGQTGTNAYIGNAALPRGLWTPWKSSGSYDTADEWVTVSMPLSEFNKTHEGNKCDNALDRNSFTGLTFFIWNGGTDGTDCTPKVCIDNIRVVPVE